MSDIVVATAYVVDDSDGFICDFFDFVNFDIYYLNDVYGPYKQMQFFDLDDNFICAYRFKDFKIVSNELFLYL